MSGLVCIRVEPEKTSSENKTMVRTSTSAVSGQPMRVATKVALWIVTADYCGKRNEARDKASEAMRVPRAPNQPLLTAEDLGKWTGGGSGPSFTADGEFDWSDGMSFQDDVNERAKREGKSRQQVLENVATRLRAYYTNQMKTYHEEMAKWNSEVRPRIVRCIVSSGPMDQGSSCVISTGGALMRVTVTDLSPEACLAPCIFQMNDATELVISGH